jgi:hypothetical protein
MQQHYELAITTQGPSYPPSEVMNEDGDFVVIGQLNVADGTGGCRQEWGAAVVSVASPVPEFGINLPYTIKRRIDLTNLSAADEVLHTLPLPLPCHNYPMQFAPQQQAEHQPRASYAFHEAPIPDLLPEHGRKLQQPIRLSNWIKARGQLTLTMVNASQVEFKFNFSGMIPESLYTVMALRQHDLNPARLTRPGPLGVPNVFITDQEGNGSYRAVMTNPFPGSEEPNSNRIVNVVVLWMSTQMSYGGAIGHVGLGGDIHAQLKLPQADFFNFMTVEN